MEKRYQVFVSSTYEDLKEERQKVISALIALNCFPAAMEFFQASDEDHWSLIKRVIDQCDYYILILGGKYGSIDEKTGLSYTEIEYDYAISKGIPVIAFVHENPENLAASKYEQSEASREKLKSFRAKISKHWKKWANPDALASVAILAMVNLKELRPTSGWIRATDAVDPEKMNALHSRIEDLESRLAKVTNLPPEGIESLAKGEEKTKVPLWMETASGPSTGALQVSWNDLFGIIGPLMLSATTERILSEHLGNALAQRLNRAAFNVVLQENSFEKIKLQFFALGLIRRVDGADHTWRLTPYGEAYLVRAIAEKTAT